ncbi:hypothetical protein OZ410_02545 [Robiginitalea sp. M366]|nr:hypothetical protein [Robiginitalea aestuariiviva]MDG1571178.1 hypothetical protein [Robiginitalea aestuariiviva]
MDRSHTQTDELEPAKINQRNLFRYFLVILAVYLASLLIFLL